ncbi:MAG: 2-oxoacid:ferredoxin oxidoreductase subunit beta [Schleiferiaceae bacterium]|nr:2-oxoacid:ferredoxin oxidoreductase subunit beta [Schleiferiaceae bacterium]
MTTDTVTAKDFATDQDVRWCPGCGDYSILKQVQSIMPELGLPKEDIAFISGIGCSSRFPYYMDTYGMHSIHGRATAIASGLKAARPELSVWIITGDGDGLSIGGNHLIHLLRRNVDVNILLFNNEIYGLTKGQYSPTSELGKFTKSSPLGVIDQPFNPLSLAMGADASFIARAIDRDPILLRDVLRAGNLHKGSSFIEIYQNCNVFNDGAFDPYSDKKRKAEETLILQEGKPLVFGLDNAMGIQLDGLTPRMVSLATCSADDLWIHDSKDHTKAWLLTRFFDDPKVAGHFPRPFGVFYQQERPTYEKAMQEQVKQAVEKFGEGDLDVLLAGRNNWEI